MSKPIVIKCDRGKLPEELVKAIFAEMDKFAEEEEEEKIESGCSECGYDTNNKQFCPLFGEDVDPREFCARCCLEKEFGEDDWRCLIDLDQYAGPKDVRDTFIKMNKVKETAQKVEARMKEVTSPNKNLADAYDQLSPEGKKRADALCAFLGLNARTGEPLRQVEGLGLAKSEGSLAKSKESLAKSGKKEPGKEDKADIKGPFDFLKNTSKPDPFPAPFFGDMVSPAKKKPVPVFRKNTPADSFIPVKVIYNGRLFTVLVDITAPITMVLNKMGVSEVRKMKINDVYVANEDFHGSIKDFLISCGDCGTDILIEIM